jgi:hypothetical protein
MMQQDIKDELAMNFTLPHLVHVESELSMQNSSDCTGDFLFCIKFIHFISNKYKKHAYNCLYTCFGWNKLK